MSRADDVARAVTAIEGDLADGRWHDRLGLGGWRLDPQIRVDAIGVLERREAIEVNSGGKRTTYRLIPKPAPRQTALEGC